jgi:biopolymer transport protein ExbB
MNLLSVILQVTTPVSTTTAAMAADENLLDLLLKGGWIVYPLTALFILSLYIIIERTFAINIYAKKDASLLSRVNELVSESKFEKAAKLCKEQQNLSAQVIAAGLEVAEEGIAEAQEAMETEARHQVSVLEKGMAYLGITSSIAPMLGFLGTIAGVVKIFHDISVSNKFDITTLSSGLYQKMISSGLGLFVGIIAYAGYTLLNNRIDTVILRVEKTSTDFLKFVKQQKQEKAQ